MFLSWPVKIQCNVTMDQTFYSQRENPQPLALILTALCTLPVPLRTHHLHQLILSSFFQEQRLPQLSSFLLAPFPNEAIFKIQFSKIEDEKLPQPMPFIFMQVLYIFVIFNARICIPRNNNLMHYFLQEATHFISLFLAKTILPVE